MPSKDVVRRLKENDPELMDLYLWGKLSPKLSGRGGAAIISRALRNNVMLRKIILNEVRFGEEGYRIFSETLKSHKALRSLTITNDKIGIGCTSIMEMLKVNTSIDTLMLSDTGISSEDCVPISEMLVVNSTLSHLYLPNNNIGNSGCELLGEAMKGNATLLMLELRNNNISEECLYILWREIRSYHAIKNHPKCEVAVSFNTRGERRRNI